MGPKTWKAPARRPWPHSGRILRSFTFSPDPELSSGGRMRFRRVEAAAAAQAERASVSLYQLTLNGLLQPFWFYAAFNAVGALSYLLLGHPIVAAVAFAAYCAIDFIQLRLSGRWLAEAHATGDEAGFGKLARLCFVRFSVYLAPVVFIALTGGTAELMLFALEACTLLAVSMAAGMMSR